MAAAAGWSHLPEDLLYYVFDRLYPADQVRSSAACTSWRSAASRNPRHPHFPWILLPRTDDDDDDVAERRCRFYSVPDGERLNTTHPTLRWATCLNSSNRWLVVLAGSDLHIFSPLTGAHFPLPPADTLPGRTFDKAAVAWRAPSAYTVALVYRDGRSSRLAFAREGSSSWDSSTASSRRVDDVICHDGKFYALDFDGGITAWQPNPPRRISTVVGNRQYHQNPPLHMPSVAESRRFDVQKEYLAAVSGELLRVLRNKIRVREGKSYRTCSFEVYSLDSHQWVPVRGLGDCSLFVGTNSAITFSAPNSLGAKGNCIYFTDAGLTDDAGVYDFQDGSIRSCCGDFSWPGVVWFMHERTRRDAVEKWKF